jgi:hypothetical protein
VGGEKLLESENGVPLGVLQSGDQCGNLAARLTGIVGSARTTVEPDRAVLREHSKDEPIHLVAE